MIKTLTLTAHKNSSDFIDCEYLKQQATKTSEHAYNKQKMAIYHVFMFLYKKTQYFSHN